MASGVTDSTGMVRLATGPGNFTVKATAAGFTPASGQQVAVSAGPGDSTLVISMEPVGAQPGVVVSVVDPNGNPVVGATVTSTP